MGGEGEKSRHWDDYCDTKDQIEGFPFREGFPDSRSVNKSYELILRNGNRCYARVDDSTQYRAEGLSWFTLTPMALDESESGRSLNEAVVAAWKELKQDEIPVL